MTRTFLHSMLGVPSVSSEHLFVLRNRLFHWSKYPDSPRDPLPVRTAQALAPLAAVFALVSPSLRHPCSVPGLVPALLEDICFSFSRHCPL